MYPEHMHSGLDMGWASCVAAANLAMGQGPLPAKSLEPVPLSPLLAWQHSQVCEVIQALVRCEHI